MAATRPARGTRLPILLLVAVLLSIVALAAHPLIPKHRWQVTPAGEDYDLVSTQLPDGTPSGRWTGAGKKSFSCSYPAGFNDPNYYCSWNRRFDWESHGVDLSRFQAINLKVRYRGGGDKVKLFARNYNEAYSRREDFNSTKYNVVFIPASELGGQTISVDLREFAVAEWWLQIYRLPRRMAVPELKNIVILGLDFSYPMTPGLHEVWVDEIELVGDWIPRGTWYLALLSLWLFGIFAYQINQLRLARRQLDSDIQLIDHLSHDNRHLQEETSRFRRLSTVDPLTQAYNRFGIDQVVHALVAARSHAHPAGDLPLFCLVLLDIDHFKKVNDTQGHDAGDRVLQAVSASVNSRLRPNDHLCRWGGEEFLVVLPYTRLEQAVALAEQCRAQVEEEAIPLQDGALRVTASFGVASCRDGDFATAFKRADEALYDAKRGGRNRVALAGDERAGGPVVGG